MFWMSETHGQVVRGLHVLSHMAIFPRIANSPTWRVTLSTAAVLLLWPGPRSSLESSSSGSIGAMMWQLLLVGCAARQLENLDKASLHDEWTSKWSSMPRHGFNTMK